MQNYDKQYTATSFTLIQSPIWTYIRSKFVSILQRPGNIYVLNVRLARIRGFYYKLLSCSSLANGGFCLLDSKSSAFIKKN